MTTNGRLHRRISAASWRSLLTALLWLGVATSGLAAEADPNPLQPVDTSSPRSTFLAFREHVEAAYRRWRLRESRHETEVEAQRAFRTLDLSGIGAALLEEIGIGDALYLYDTMNRIDLPPVEQIPDAAMAKANNLARWTVPGTEITIAKIADGERAGEFLFTADTSRRARHFYQLVQDLPPKRGEGSVVATWRAAPGIGMPDMLAARVWDLPRWAFYPILDQPLWKWLSALLATLVTAGFGWLVWRAGRKWDRRCARLDVGWRIGEPAAALCAIAIAGRPGDVPGARGPVPRAAGRCDLRRYRRRPLPSPRVVRRRGDRGHRQSRGAVVRVGRREPGCRPHPAVLPNSEHHRRPAGSPPRRGRVRHRHHADHRRPRGRRARGGAGDPAHARKHHGRLRPVRRQAGPGRRVLQLRRQDGHGREDRPALDPRPRS